MTADAAGIYNSLTTTPAAVADNNLPAPIRNSTGHYIFTFGTALANSNYVIKALANTAGAEIGPCCYLARTASGFHVMVFSGGSVIDPGELSVEVSLV